VTCEHADQARWLMMIVRELRELKLDLPLVKLDEDGVTQMDMNLTDELVLIALNIDFAAAIAIDTEPSDGSEPEQKEQR